MTVPRDDSRTGLSALADPFGTVQPQLCARLRSSVALGAVLLEDRLNIPGEVDRRLPGGGVTPAAPAPGPGSRPKARQRPSRWRGAGTERSLSGSRQRGAGGFSFAPTDWEGKVQGIRLGARGSGSGSGLGLAGFGQLAAWRAGWPIRMPYFKQEGQPTRTFCPPVYLCPEFDQGRVSTRWPARPSGCPRPRPGRRSPGRS